MNAKLWGKLFDDSGEPRRRRARASLGSRRRFRDEEVQQIGRARFSLMVGLP
ncbi:MAG: hypothetical protein R3A44_03880 [Caldilineaceae bacterium]